MPEHDFLDATATPLIEYEPVDDPYAGLNRAQRRKAKSAERRAFKKLTKQ